MFVCMSVRTYVHACMHAFVHACVRPCMYVHTCVRTFEDCSRPCRNVMLQLARPLVALSLQSSSTCMTQE